MTGLLETLLEALGRQRFEASEVYLKRGRSRRYEIGPAGAATAVAEEEGWAVRAGTPRGSFHAAGSGRPVAEGPWPEPAGGRLRLPPPASPGAWKAPALEDGLLAEREAFRLLESIAAELDREAPGARLVAGFVEEGTSEVALGNSRGVRAAYRGRAAALYLEAAGPPPAAALTTLLLAEGEARRLEARAAARRLANRLLLPARGRPPERERGELLIAPPVALRLLAGLVPLLVGPDGAELAAGLRDRRGRIGAPVLTVVDDGRLPGGVLEAPVDGEGTPTREVLLIEDGVYRQPLVAWRHERSAPGRSSGCVRRDGWRDVPRLAPSHLYLQPDPAVSAASLVGSVARGFYLAETRAGGLVDPQGDRLAVPVCGFELRQGRAQGPIGEAWLCGSVKALLGGIQAVARDLRFEPVGGMVGSPSLLVTGLEVRSAPG